MKFKRILSALLTLTLLLSCICIFASAESESYEGLYNGYRYRCYGQVTKSKCYVEIEYKNSTPTIMMSGTFGYTKTDNKSYSDTYFIRGKSNTFVSNMPTTGFKAFTYLNAEYYIGTAKVVTIPLTAT